MRGGRPRQILGIALLVLWLFAVLAAFYVVQKPFTPQTARAIARFVLDVATTMLMSRLVAASGLGVLSLVRLGLGMVSPFYPWLIWALTVAGLVVTGDRFGVLHRRFELGLPGASETFSDCYGHCDVTLIVGLAWALIPPTARDGPGYYPKRSTAPI
jgi:hypothetical protein